MGGRTDGRTTLAAVRQHLDYGYGTEECCFKVRAWQQTKQGSCLPVHRPIRSDSSGGKASKVTGEMAAWQSVRPSVCLTDGLLSVVVTGTTVNHHCHHGDGAPYLDHRCTLTHKQNLPHQTFHAAAYAL